MVNEGYDKDAMKDPGALRSMQGLQRYLERDPEVGYSFSLVDILTAVNGVFHELEPKWGVIPNNWVDVGGLFFIFFSSSPPTETAKYVDPGYTTSHVTFFCRNHKGDTIRRIMMRVEEYIGTSYTKQLGLEVAEDNLPGQELYAGNMRGHWVVDPCKANGGTCETGDECCNGYCRTPEDGGALVCTDKPQGCAQEFEKCAVDGDCCGASAGYTCLNGHCARPPVN